jgi:hypothetical protein
MITGASLKTIDPYITVLHIPSQIPIRESDWLHGALDFKSPHRSAAVVGSLLLVEHPLWDDVDLQRCAGHQATAFFAARRCARENFLGSEMDSCRVIGLQ